MDPVKLAVLAAGAFFLAFGLAAYRHFYTVLGATAGLAAWMALRETLVQVPGLKEHPGTASLLILVLLILTGIFFASRFRRLLAFFSGLATGVILSQAVSGFMTAGDLSGAAFGFSRIDSMDILAGMIAGVLFLLFERVFAVLLTSVVGSFLCAWVIGGRWTFLACLLVGLVAQPLVFTRFKPQPSAAGGRDRTGSTTLLAFLLLLTVPSSAAADWTVERINFSTSRVVIAAGWRDGLREGEKYAVVDERGMLVTRLSVGEIYSTSSYSEALSQDTLKKVRSGMRVMVLEEFEFNQALKLGGESRLLEFLDNYPESRRRQEIIEALDENRFRLAELTGTIEAYRGFQRKYPTSRYASAAREREERLAFESARSVGSEEAFRDFLTAYPGTTLISGMAEVQAYLRARKTDKVFAFQDFLAAYPRSSLADEFIPSIDEFELWAERLEFGSDPVQAVRYFAQLGDATAVPFLVGKLNVKTLEKEAGRAILMIGKPALSVLMEVLISPLQSVELKDKIAYLIAEMGELSTIPAMRTYVEKEKTQAGREALLMLEEKVAR